MLRGGEERELRRAIAVMAVDKLRVGLLIDTIDTRPRCVRAPGGNSYRTRNVTQYTKTNELAWIHGDSQKYIIFSINNDYLPFNYI